MWKIENLVDWKSDPKVMYSFNWFNLKYMYVLALICLHRNNGINFKCKQSRIIYFVCNVKRDLRQVFLLLKKVTLHAFTYFIIFGTLSTYIDMVVYLPSILHEFCCRLSINFTTGFMCQYLNFRPKMRYTIPSLNIFYHVLYLLTIL